MTMPMPPPLSEIDAEIARRRAPKLPALKAIDAEVARRRVLYCKDPQALDKAIDQALFGTADRARGVDLALRIVQQAIDDGADLDANDEMDIPGCAEMEDDA